MFLQISWVGCKCWSMIEWIDVSESIDPNKTDGSRECIISRYWYFLRL